MCILSPTLAFNSLSSWDYRGQSPKICNFKANKEGFTQKWHFSKGIVQVSQGKRPGSKSSEGFVEVRHSVSQDSIEARSWGTEQGTKKQRSQTPQNFLGLCRNFFLVGIKHKALLDAKDILYTESCASGPESTVKRHYQRVLSRNVSRPNFPTEKVTLAALLGVDGKGTQPSRETGWEADVIMQVTDDSVSDQGVNHQVVSRSWILGVSKIKAAGLAICLVVGSGRKRGFQEDHRLLVLNSLQDQVTTDLNRKARTRANFGGG